MPWFRSEKDRVADELEKVHAELLRIARQVEAHSELAPYSQVEARLRDIRDTGEESARAVSQRMIELGRRPAGTPGGSLRGGRNAWERLIVDLEDYRALLRQLSQVWARWDDEHPGDAALVRRVLDDATRSRDALNDLLARSDPHALN